ncbi:hypothetical protein JCM14469_42590 [Desulfatiferula olefinivorans]
MIIESLINHLEIFIMKRNVSVQWAKDAESLLDEFDVLDEVLDELQEYLSLYRPEGGPHLYDEKDMDSMCKRAVTHLKKLLK